MSDRRYHHLGDLSRRKFMAYASKALLGVGLSGMLRAPSLWGASPSKPARRTARNVIYLYMGGGMSHMDTLDPKPRGGEAAGPFKTIRPKGEAESISEHLPGLASVLDQCAVIRSLHSNQGAHEPGSYFLHTSYAPRSTIRHPGMGAWLNQMSGRTNSTLPGNIRIGGGSKAEGGSGFLEGRYDPLHIGDPEGGLQHDSLHESVDEREFRERLDLAQWMSLYYQERNDSRLSRSYADAYEEAVALMKSEDLKAFDLSLEEEAVREAYGESQFGRGCLLARRLIEHDVRYVEVTYGGWDTHEDNFNRVADRSQVLDKVLSTLIRDLRVRGLLGETLVVLGTEFGRSPEINGNDGRDHHPAAFSGLLAGGGIRGGQVYGKTDKQGNRVEESLVSIPDFNATIAYALGLPLDKVVHSPSGRPFTVADHGRPVLELF